MTSDHVSLASAKRLQEAGWKEETEYCYVKHDSWDDFRLLCKEEREYELIEFSERHRGWIEGFVIIAAPSTAELFKLLPNGYYLEKAESGFLCQTGNLDDEIPCTFNDNPADTLASMACYLLENGLIPKK